MIYVYTVTRRDIFPNTPTEGASSKFISVHLNLSSANKAAKAHCKSQIREAGGSTRHHQIEYHWGAAVAEYFKGTVRMSDFDDGREWIEVEVNEVVLRDDGTNGDNDLEEWDSDGDDDGDDLGEDDVL